MKNEGESVNRGLSESERYSTLAKTLREEIMNKICEEERRGEGRGKDRVWINEITESRMRFGPVMILICMNK